MCVHRETGAQRAVKVLRKSHMDDDEKRMLFNEINILKEIVSKRTRQQTLQKKINYNVKSNFPLYSPLVRVNQITLCCIQDHPNIIKMYEFFEDDKRYYLVTE